MSGNARSIGGGNVYLVAARDFVVSQDLADTVADFDPGATILTARNCREALTAIRSIRASNGLALAFVEAGPDQVARSRLDIAIRDRGGRFVLLGDDAEDEWENGSRAGRVWPVRMRPFSSQVVTALLIASRHG